MNRPKILIRFYCFLIYCIAFSVSVPAIAQVVPDNTLGTQVNSLNELHDRIEGGEIRGENLFHSFQEFNVDEGLEVYFANPNGIANIFSRVTGGNVSEIWGTLGVDGAASLFLINPNGIVFDQNTTIDVTSFIATTASQINFADGTEFSTDPERTDPLLTVSIPIGLEFSNETPQDILVRGNPNNIFVEIPSFVVNKENLPDGTEASSQNLLLIGGNINFEGGSLTVSDGRIELGSVSDNETVDLDLEQNGWHSSFNNVENFQDINLNNGALIDAGGQGNGKIEINARNVSILEGSAILLETTNNSVNGEIEVNADSLELRGSLGENSVSLISTDVLSDAQGMGSIITLNVEELNMFDGSLIRAVSFSDFGGRAGKIELNTREIFLTGINPFNGGLPTGITTSTGIESLDSEGNDLIINTDLLRVTDGGRIKADSFNSGDGGDLQVTANFIELSGVNPVLPAWGTGLETSVSPENISTSQAGDILIETNTLQISNGARIRAANDGSGQAGNIVIAAENITIVGPNEQFPFFEGGISTSNFNGVDNGGNININTDFLQMAGGRIAANSPRGRGGDIAIKASNISLDNSSSIEASTIFGQGGDLAIENNDQINVTGDSKIVALSERDGKGGEVNITTYSLQVTAESQIAANSLGGEGGDLYLDTSDLNIDNASLIEASTISGNGGNLFIDADNLLISNQSKIQAIATNNGNGGFIELNSQNSLIRNNSSIVTRAEVGQGGNITVNSSQLELLDDSSISASAGGEGNGGNITINSDTLTANNSDLDASAVAGIGGNITINSQGFFVSPNSSITASSSIGIDGTVEINAPENEIQRELETTEPRIIVTETEIANSCLERRISLTRGGVGGFRQTPTSNFNSTSFSLTGVNSLPKFSTDKPLIDTQNMRSSDPALISADTIITTEDGRTLLVAKSRVAKPIFCEAQI